MSVVRWPKQVRGSCLHALLVGLPESNRLAHVDRHLGPDPAAFLNKTHPMSNEDGAIEWG